MAEALLIGLVEWAIRAAVLAGVVGVVLWALRVTSPHVRLTAWTLVLTGAMLMPLASQVMPPLLGRLA